MDLLLTPFDAIKSFCLTNTYDCEYAKRIGKRKNIFLDKFMNGIILVGI
jgi:hypothetical protein